MDEIPTKPYVLRALFDWCVDNGYTPHLAVKVDARTQVPLEYAKGGEITLNIAPTAVHKLQMGNDLIEFSARFGGVARQISVPVHNVFAIYARETGNGMTFEVEAPPADRGDADAASQGATPSGISVVPSSRDPGHDPSDPPNGGTPQGAGKPALRRIK